MPQKSIILVEILTEYNNNYFFLTKKHEKQENVRRAALFRRQNWTIRVSSDAPYCVSCNPCVFIL